MACPGWMLGVIEGNAEGVEGWDIADVFPGGGGNWGGSYLTVPAQGDNIEEAKEVAAWLTAPEQQVKAFLDKSTFPSQVEALSMPEVTGAVDAVLQRRPDRRDPRQPGEGRHRAAAQGPEVLRHPAGVPGGDPPGRRRVAGADESWEQFQTDVEALG